MNMKKTVFFPLLVVLCSAISAVIFHSPYTYFNLFLSAVFLYMALFSGRRKALSRIKYSALWLLMLELLAIVLLTFGVNLYQPSSVWSMYALFAAVDIFITPRIVKEE